MNKEKLVKLMAEDDYDWWKEQLKDKRLKRFMLNLPEKCNVNHIIVIGYGILDGLSLKEIKVYAKPAFDFDQMNQIKSGFRQKLSFEQVQVYADSKFDDEQMKELKVLLTMYPMEKVKLVANPHLNSNQMGAILINGKSLPDDIILKYADPNMESEKLKIIYSALEKGFTEEQVDVLWHPYFTISQMEEIKKGFENGLSVEKVKLYAKPAFNFEQMEQIRLGFEKGLSKSKVKLYANPEFKVYQMEEIRASLQDNIPVEIVKLYAKPSVCTIQLLRSIAKECADKEKIKRYALLDRAQLKQILAYEKEGLDEEYIRFIANPAYPNRVMGLLHTAALVNKSLDELEKIAQEELYTKEEKELLDILNE